jgi:fructose-1,6-bisphosphatase I
MTIINRNVLTLDEFTIQQLRDFPNATGELSGLLRDMGLAAKRVNVEVNKAGLVDILGDVGAINVQGEDVKKLDVFANNQFTMASVVRVSPVKSSMNMLLLMMR